MCINKLLGESLCFLAENKVNISFIFHIRKGFIGLCSEKEVVSISEEQVESMKYDSMDDTTHFVSAVGKEADSIISLLDLNAVVLDKNFKEENA